MSQQQAASKSTRLFVAAIDFGTTYSGYAFSSKAEWVKVRTPKWAGNMMSFKAPTAVLLNSDQSFHSFGYEAETKYIELAGDKEHTDYFYFHRFKMTLKKEKVRCFDFWFILADDKNTVFLQCKMHFMFTIS